ncbi:cysteine desulfurase-like protein [Nocardioides bigeumensis]|jgi:cysteine desulfurase family protein (TIGR01976 family)
MAVMTYDVAAVRKEFPALVEGPSAGLARFDGPGGSLTPASVADAVATAMRSGLCQRGSLTAPDRLADEITLGARAAMARFTGLGDPRGIVFGRSMTAITMDVARILAREWGPGDEIVLTRLDHDGDVRPWVIAAERAGATVRWLGFDTTTCELDDIAPLLSERTRLVAVTAASNLLGTRPDLPAISAAAHAVDALMYVDAVHLAPHAPLDFHGFGADFLVCSPYKFFGPHLGVLASTPERLESMHPDKLLPSTNVVPERFELGTLPYELLAGVRAAVEVAESLGMSAVESHERALMARLLEGLGALERVTVHGRPARRTPTALLTFDGIDAHEVSASLAERGVVAPADNFYALEASRHLGLGDEGGMRVGLSAYTDETDVDRLLVALGDALSR